MELELVDSWHHDIASFVLRNKAINALLAEVGDTDSSSFVLLIQLLEGFPLVLDLHAVQRTTSAWRWEMNKE